MKNYFYSNGHKKEGPVTYDELKVIGIKPSTLIWHEGLEDWKKADSINELKELLESSLPLIEKRESIMLDKESNDFLLEKETPTENKRKVKKQKMFSELFSFDGRIRRLEYGISLIIFIVLTPLALIFFQSENSQINGLLLLPFFYFILTQGVKRCHDLGKNGWQLINPLYQYLMIFKPGQSGKNEYGKNPKE